MSCATTRPGVRRAAGTPSQARATASSDRLSRPMSRRYHLVVSQGAQGKTCSRSPRCNLASLPLRCPSAASRACATWAWESAPTNRRGIIWSHRMVAHACECGGSVPEQAFIVSRIG